MARSTSSIDASCAGPRRVSAIDSTACMPKNATQTASTSEIDFSVRIVRVAGRDVAGMRERSRLSRLRGACAGRIAPEAGRACFDAGPNGLSYLPL